MLDERIFAFLERDRVDHALALDAFETGLDDAPFRGIDHYRNTGDVGLGGNQRQVACHRLFGIDQALVHVDIEDLRAAGDLLACNLDGFFVAIFLDQLLELRTAGDVGTLADVDEQQLRGDDQRFQAGQAGVAGHAPSPLAAYGQLKTLWTRIRSDKHGQSIFKRVSA